MQVWANYRQKRPLLSGQPPHHPSLTWQEMWPLQDSNQRVIATKPLETTAAVAKLTPVETIEGNSDLTVCTQPQKKQHKMLSVCSQKQVMSQTLIHTHICTQTNELM